MLRQSSITIILLLASLGARSFAIESTDSPDSFDGWEPIYSIPHSAPQKGDATITLIEPNTELMILGKSEISHHVICKFIRQNNPDFSEEIAKAYIKLGDSPLSSNHRNRMVQICRWHCRHYRPTQLLWAWSDSTRCQGSFI